MSSFDRRHLLLAALALGGCGLRPVYGSGGALTGGIAVDTPDSREAFRLKARIEDRLGPPDNAQLTLTVALALDEQPVGVSTGQDITRYTLRGSADYALADLSGALVDSGTVRSFTSYSATGTSVSTLAAERDARDRLAIILADQILSRAMLAVS